MHTLSCFLGCIWLKFKQNLNTVAHTPTIAEMGTACFMSKSKKISMIGMLLPAPESPPAFDKAIKNSKTHYFISKKYKLELILFILPWFIKNDQIKNSDLCMLFTQVRLPYSSSNASKASNPDLLNTAPAVCQWWLAGQWRVLGN